jgi:hypothetical protein
MFNMNRLPNIPMSPSALPQGEVPETVSLPLRPDRFDFQVGYGRFSAGVVPKQGVPRAPDFLIQMEWAQTPVHNGLDRFCLQARKKYWLLWLGTLDDNSYPWRWLWQPVAYCNRAGVDWKLAAVHLLLEYWKFRIDQGDVSADKIYDWIDEEGLLSVADVRAIEAELRRQRAAKPGAVPDRDGLGLDGA